MDGPGLSAHLIRFRLVSDCLGTCVHVALTARCKPCSGSIPCLEEPKRAGKKRDEERQPEYWPHSIKIEQEGNHDACGKGRDSKNEPLAALSRSNVGDADRGVHMLFNLDDSRRHCQWIIPNLQLDRVLPRGHEREIQQHRPR